MLYKSAAVLGAESVIKPQPYKTAVAVSTVVIFGTIAMFTYPVLLAMTALGAETSIDKFRQAGAKPFILAAILFIWLMGGGYLLARYIGPLL